MLPKSIEKNIKLSKVIDKKIPQRLIGDPTRLNQVLLNLVGNAIKFTEKGEVKISVEQLNEDKDFVNLEFKVIDTGIGIPQDKLPSIFDAFTQATYDTTRKYGGTGLGLAIVKQLIELQGGEINVKSQEKEGSVFSFNIIYRKSTLEGKHPDTKTDGPEMAVIKDLHVLLVEDNVLNQMLAEKVLTDWGWTVDVAENGLIAVEKAEKNSYNVVLMDIQLPEMDGYEATRYIRTKLQASKAKVPIIAMTAHAISGEEEKCMAAGMNGYVSKPFNSRNLYMKIATVLNVSGNATPVLTEQPMVKSNGNGSGKHIDLTYLKKLSNGSNEFIEQMIKLFIEQTPEAVGKLEQHLAEHNWAAMGKVAHKMKPSVMFVGIKEIENDVKMIEDYATNESHTDELAEMVEHVKTVCDKAINELKAEMELLH